jgi:hypothetical protein
MTRGRSGWLGLTPYGTFTRYSSPALPGALMDQFTRRIIGFGVHIGDVDGIALCRMFNSAISSRGIPKYLSSDNDPLFLYHQWQANLRILGADEIKAIPYTPLSHPFVERLIGTIRQEFLDQTLFWNATDLERKLDDFRRYYNSHRVHTALKDATPSEMPGKSVRRCADLSQYQWKSPLPWSLSTAHSCVNTNSPHTGRKNHYPGTGARAGGAKYPGQRRQSPISSESLIS